MEYSPPSVPPSTQTSLGLSFCPLTPAFPRPSPKDMVGGQPRTCMPRGMAASSMSSSRMWMATMSTARPYGRQGHRFHPGPSPQLYPELNVKSKHSGLKQTLIKIKKRADMLVQHFQFPISCVRPPQGWCWQQNNFEGIVRYTLSR